MQKKTSIHDIAKELKVSATTISFVLNGKGQSIRPEIQKRILDYTKRIGYQPNLIAKSLRTGRTNIIAMLVESISDPFFSSIAKFVESYAFDLGYKVFFASTENETGKTKSLINIFKDRQVDGYIIAPPPGIEDDIYNLIQMGKPVVVFDRYLPDLNTTNIVIDNFESSYKAVTHLIENGFRKIAMITLNSLQTQMVERLTGYQVAMDEKKFEKTIKALPYNLPEKNIIKEIKTFLKHHPELDAVFFSTNYLALSGLEAIQSLSLSVPENLAVVSFDDNSYFRLCKPSITAVAQPIEEISKHVTDSLMKAISTKNIQDAKVNLKVLPAQLIIRNSSKNIAKDACKQEGEKVNKKVQL